MAIVWLGFETVLARAFLWLGWLMSIYRELLACQIDQQPTHPRTSHLSILTVYCSIGLPADQASRSFPPVLARLSYWP